MSTLVVSNISDGTTTIGITSTSKGGAKAYIRADNGGSILDSYNISAVTINSNGNLYTCTFTNPMPNNQYLVVATVNTTELDGTVFVRNFTVNSFDVVVRDYDGNIGNAGIAAVVYSETT
tara:strand:- start:126 stop:485 length:360 start_codon:yes stop_codon:yes gene_type:complete